MAYISGFDRKQSQLFPSCIEELIPALSEVRIIDMYLDSMDMAALGFKEDDPDDNGRPGYSPGFVQALHVWLPQPDQDFQVTG